MNYKETIDYLFTQLPAYQKVGKSAFKKDLTNIIKLCAFLDNPHLKFKSVHIAGTNGKGSTAHMLASIFQEAGYKTGLYTSPHLVDFRERIKIDGNFIHKNSVIQFVKRIKPIMEDIQPSFFEITVAMAFYAFAKQKVDIAIIETGLGGRLDSTNVIQPIVSIITNIGLEHQAFLGDTLEAIAGEKGGIIKEHIPVVIGEYKKSTAKVFNTIAKTVSAPIHYAKDTINISEPFIQLNHTKYSISNTYNKKTFDILCELKGLYQAKNIATVLSSTEVVNNISEYNLTQTNIKNGFKNVVKNTNFWGRWQQINSKPRIILDCAHNVEGIKEIKAHLKLEKYNQLHIIYGCVSDKDLQKITKLLPKKANYYLTEPSVARAKPLKDTLKDFTNGKLTVKYESIHPKKCLEAAISLAQTDDLILITGSVFLVADFLNL